MVFLTEAQRETLKVGDVLGFKIGNYKHIYYFRLVKVCKDKGETPQYGLLYLDYKNAMYENAIEYYKEDMFEAVLYMNEWYTNITLEKVIPREKANLEIIHIRIKDMLDRIKNYFNKLKEREGSYPVKSR